MNTKWRTITIFISSTFSDMQSERDYLNSFVFPLVKQELKKYAISLRVIDLRWGVNTLDNEEGTTVENKIIRICFDEIDRSKPFFLGLLGERYGWIPSEERTAELSNRYNVKRNTSITSMEIEYGVLNNENIHSIFFEREKSSYAKIPEIYRSAFDEKYSNLKSNEKEERIQKLEKLKNDIRRTLKKRNQDENYYTYTATWEESKFSGLEDFGRKVRKVIMERVISFISSEGETCTKNIQEIEERILQDEFIFEHTKILAERERMLETIKEDLLKTNKGIILTGHSGQGKSSVYSSLVASLKTHPADKYLILYHSAGINIESTGVLNMLKRWIYEIATYIDSPIQEVLDIEQCLNYLKALLKRVPSEVKVIMLIDSLDSFQAENVSRYLTFFPRYEYRDISLFCTSTPGSENFAIKYNHLINRLECPVIAIDEAKAIVHSFFDYYRKEIHKDVLNILLTKNDEKRLAFTSPLWLTMAMQLLLNIGEEDFAKAKSIDFTNEEEKIREFQKRMINEFPSEPKDLFRYFLDKVKNVYDKLPEQIFLLIACSCDGLHEEDIQSILGKEWDPVIFALIHSFFARLLIEQGRDKVWKLAHKQLIKSFDEEEKNRYYPILFNYFWSKYEADPHNVRVNLLYYLHHAKEFEKAYMYISDSDNVGIERITTESLLLIDSVGLTNFIEFLNEISMCNTYREFIFFPRKLREILMVGSIKELVRNLTAKLRYVGEYNKALLISEFYADRIINSKMFGDFKIVLYTLATNDMANAVDGLRDSKEQKRVYEQIVKNVKVKGLASLIIVPITKRFYKWELFKLKNNN